MKLRTEKIDASQIRTEKSDTSQIRVTQLGGKKMQNEELWSKLEEDCRVEKRWTLKEVGIGLVAGGLFVIVAGWLYFVTVMAR